MLNNLPNKFPKTPL